MQRLAAKLIQKQLRPVATSLRPYSSDYVDVDKILGKTLPKEERNALKDKLQLIEKDSYDDAMPSQTQELFAETESLLSDITVKKETQLPSRSFLKRGTSRAMVALKREMFLRAQSDGLSEEDARKLADSVVEKAARQYNLKQDSELAKLQEEQAQEQEKEAEVDEKQQKIYEMAAELFEQISAPETQQASGMFTRVKIEPSKKLPRIFGTSEGALGIFDADKLRSSVGTFWNSMEDEKATITNLSMGPRNGFEEQIEWTEGGKLWPYPINNEYLLGDEEKVHFTEHIFLDRYLQKHKHLPKSGPVAHFMELVVVGLSKNPYMTLKKKHAHLDSFAEFFNTKRIKEIEKMHADEQAATL
ncbi:unnamed protein product [Bursaphelenchus xylophilus]|uniref:Small ribosomal subunit protein mS31 n=1 Tax=Bursaphelenchus xylophilus TaxID=6326 RepID=A0A1I7S208_BURXY|nr:unnamed protein product [Bursaphelenchus xylophilus]CAG9090246.1 unnamed protein product [Bursaphelenchus xylophilus]